MDLFGHFLVILLSSLRKQFHYIMWFLWVRNLGCAWGQCCGYTSEELGQLGAEQASLW